ncbi:MAG: iron-sulfur cluster repair di-iron protein, ric [Bacillota bacterium]|jgi:iron-sulfur cluster repair protein YtfE (RIC family)|nr:iron-sulfur cluster repair di-iron protein, ric [Bacillota bacterium]
MMEFEKIKERNLSTLVQYVPIVDRVHGGSHPEFNDVYKVFNELNLKLKEAGDGKPNLDNEFGRLREITGNYTVPSDVCESYAAVYNMLSELDKAYQGGGLCKSI